MYLIRNLRKCILFFLLKVIALEYEQLENKSLKEKFFERSQLIRIFSFKKKV